MIATLAILYAIGFVGTLIFNLALIIGPVMRPLAVLRNAVFWPIFLPMLISAIRER